MFLHGPAGHSSFLTQSRFRKRWDRWAEVGPMENAMGQTGRAPGLRLAPLIGVAGSTQDGASGFVGSPDPVTTAPSFVQKSSLQRAGLPDRG